MSLYNMLMGTNPAAHLLLGALDLDNDKRCPADFYDKMSDTADEFGDRDTSSEAYISLIEEASGKFFPTGRFRDIFYESLEDKTITLYTRNGGGNREYYQFVFDLLKKHPNYIDDFDDDFDSTYASITFRAPEEITEIYTLMKNKEYKKVVPIIDKMIKSNQNSYLINFKEKFQNALEALEVDETK